MTSKGVAFTPQEGNKSEAKFISSAFSSVSLDFQQACRVFTEAVSQARFSITALEVGTPKRRAFVEELLKREERTSTTAINRVAQGDVIGAVALLIGPGRAEVFGLIHALRNCGEPGDYLKYRDYPPPAILPSKCGFCGADRYPTNGWYCQACGGA